MKKPGAYQSYKQEIIQVLDFKTRGNIAIILRAKRKLTDECLANAFEQRKPAEEVARELMANLMANLNPGRKRE